MSKVIVITGAGVGLGRALARRLASDGDTIVLLGRTYAKVQAVAEELGEPHFALECDVGDPDSVRAAFAWIAQRHPAIDVLINNAALYLQGTLREMTDRQILDSLHANLAGPMFCSREALAMMRAGAQIINVTSESVEEDLAMLSVYQATKAGLERLSDSLVQELEPAGIRVCTVRAGKMYDLNKDVPDLSSDLYVRFFAANRERGHDFATDPVSNVESVTGLFRTLIDLPPDFRVTHVSTGARHPVSDFERDGTTPRPGNRLEGEA